MKQQIYYVLHDGRLAYIDYTRAKNYAKRFGCVITDKKGNVLEDFRDEKSK